MALVVLDASNKEAVLADALGETPVKAEATNKLETPAETKERIEDDLSKAKHDEPHPDDVEGEDGLTANQKKELSAKMLKAIGKKHREMKEAEEFAAAQYSERKLAEDRAARLQAELDAAKAKTPEKVEETAKPDRQNFATEGEYIEAKIKYGVDEGLRKHAAEQEKLAQERALIERESIAKGRVRDAIKIVPDFADVTGAADAVIPPAIAGYMEESVMIAELGYYFAQNPEVLVSLSKLKPALQLVQIGKIEGTLKPFSEVVEKTNGATPSKEATKASETTGIVPSKARNTAPVIQPLNTQGAVVEKDPVDMNIRETISDWQKRNSANLALRKRH